jgi:regulatory protein
MSKAYNSAVRLLARREHGAKELSNKLVSKGYSTEDIQQAVTRCQELDLQSDQRFVESFLRHRIGQGYGPLKISQELKQRGVENTLVQLALAQEEDNWLSYAMNIWQKRCKGELELSFEELQKQQRFLLYRGFGMDIVSRVVKEIR